jgi:hypothetical protein
MNTNLFSIPAHIGAPSSCRHSCSFVAKILFLEIYGLRDSLVIIRRIASEMFEQSQTGEPVLTARGRFGHDRFDADGA